MKTRYFKSGILAAALLYSAAFVSCTDDVTVGEWDGAGSIETGLNETGAVLQDLNSGKSNTTVELWKETYTAELRLVLTKAPAEGFTARAKFDTSYDAGQYNKANGTAYVLMPEACYDLPTAAVRLDNNAHTAKIGIRIDVSAITADSRCVLPVSVGSPDTEVNAAAATVLIFPVRPATEKSENAQ